MSAPANAQKVATPKEVRTLAHSLVEEFLHCRDYGHIWRQANVERIRGGFERTLFCRSCKQNKFQVLNSRGEIVKEKRDYTEGYLIKGMGRMNVDGKSILRLESVLRAVQEAEGATTSDTSSNGRRNSRARS